MSGSLLRVITTRRLTAGIVNATIGAGIFAITEDFNTVAPQANSGALIIGLLVAAIGASAGYLEAWAINPARDLGPRGCAGVDDHRGQGGGR